MANSLYLIPLSPFVYHISQNPKQVIKNNTGKNSAKNLFDGIIYFLLSILNNHFFSNMLHIKLWIILGKFPKSIFLSLIHANAN